MKLLLTSNGLSNQSIARALFELVGEDPKNTRVVYIPTASNIEVGDKSWLINDLVNLRKQGFEEIDITDISAVPENIWKPKLEKADILFFEGGDPYYLMEWMNKSGLTNLFPELLKTKVYIGVSAGSMVTNPDLALKLSQVLYGGDLDRTELMQGLNFVDFYFLPHLNSRDFPRLRKENIEKVVKGMNKKVYAMDDNSALKVIDGSVEVISEGDYLEF